MTTRPAKVSNVTTRSQTRTTKNFLTTPDPIGFYLENADKRNLRLLSKESNQAFFDNLKCANAKELREELQEELQAMRNEPEPCKNTAKVIYNPEKGIRRAIMCAIMSTGELHVYVKTGDLEPFLDSQIVKCFDQNYKLKLTLLYAPPPKPNLNCHGGFHALRLHCTDAQELEEMRQSKSLKCKNFSTDVWYNPDENMQHVIMCAIISVDQTLHLYVNQDHLTEILSFESVKCFDRNYRLRLTLLCDQDPQCVVQPGELRCTGGFRALRGAVASNEVLQDFEGVQVVRFTGIRYVADGAFRDNERLMEIFDVNTIEEIHDHAFHGCFSLRKVGELRALRTIGNHAFAGTGLAQLGDLSSLTAIGDSAFAGTGLAQLGDLSSLTTIGDSAFQDTQLAQLGDLSSLTTIGISAFQDTQLAQLGNMPELTRIKMKALKNCTKLKQLGNMQALTIIGKSAFYNCIELEKVGDMPALTIIKEKAFESCKKLKELGNMQSLKTIQDQAFKGSKLQTIFLRKSLLKVNKEAFKGCPLDNLSVEPGARFKCSCEHLASKLRLLEYVQVAGNRPPYEVSRPARPSTLA